MLDEPDGRLTLYNAVGGRSKSELAMDAVRRWEGQEGGRR